jgi:hypothetical protein
VSAVDELITWLRAQLDDDERNIQHLDDIGEQSTLPYEQLYDDIKAKRRILDLIELAHTREAFDEKLRDPADARIIFSVPIARRRLRDVLRLLAQPYAGRDGWREEWRT